MDTIVMIDGMRRCGFFDRMTGWVADSEGFLILEYGRFFLIRKITGIGDSSGHLQTGLRVARGVVGPPFGFHLNAPHRNHSENSVHSVLRNLFMLFRFFMVETHRFPVEALIG